MILVKGGDAAPVSVDQLDLFGQPTRRATVLVEVPGDGARLGRQLDAVQSLMRDGAWRTLRTIADAVGGGEASVSARLRDLRKDRYGRFVVTRRRVDGSAGLYEYRVSTTWEVKP